MGGADAQALLGRIGAGARPAGSEAEATARGICADWLRASGFDVTERPFTYSAFPGVWGTPVAGLALIVTAVASAVAIRRGVPASDSIPPALVAVASIGLIGWWLGRYGTRRLSVMRRHGVNLEARRGVAGGASDIPVVWLVAHLDSKSQPVSLLTRAVASVSVLVCWTCLLTAYILSRAVEVPGEVLFSIALCAALASIPLLISRVGVASAGALDNASGVVSVLAAVRILGLATPIGVVVTSAEEFGLAGARAWAERMPRGIAINCDGVDDRGNLTITAGIAGCSLLDDIGSTAVLGQNIRIRRSLPGILLDSTAFADLGWAACTVSQGTLRSLARVHTGRDTLEKLSGAGIDGAANLIATLSGAIIAYGSRSECRTEGPEAHGTTTFD